VTYKICQRYNRPTSNYATLHQTEIAHRQRMSGAVTPSRSAASWLEGEGLGRWVLPATFTAPPPCSCIFWPPWWSIQPIAGCNMKILLRTHRRF